MNQKVIFKERIKNNMDYLQSYGKKLTIMVKANAYGHGVSEIAKILDDYDVQLGVATWDEAISLRLVWRKEILIVQPIDNLTKIEKSDFNFVLDNFDNVREAKERGLLSRCYLKIDCGMNRFGLKEYDIKTLKKISKFLKKENFLGILSHFPFLENEKITQVQYDSFLRIRKLFGKNVKISFGGSGVLKTNLDYDECRVGISFYGYGDEKVEPIMQLKSYVIKIKSLQNGEKLGYDCRYVADRDRRIAIVSVGYGDGIRRDLTGYNVKINGHDCQIVGNICMDCLFVDITGKFCQEGDEVVFYNASQTSKYLNTIPYEVLTGYSNFRGETIVY